jgi:hypothetical protein
MSKTINFVQDRRKSLSLSEQQDQILLRKMVRIFIVIFVFFVVALGSRLFLSREFAQIIVKQQTTRASISQQESIEREFSIFSHKLTHISSLWGKRQNKQEAVAFFMRLFSGDTTVSGLSYSAETEALTFRLKTSSVFVLENALTTLASPSVTAAYPGISKSQLSRGEDASYNLNVTVALGSVESNQ